MSIPFPKNDVSSLQTYKQVFYTDNSAAYMADVVLAPATNSFGYEAGCVLALYTGGTYSGKYVNYVPSGSNGQGTPVGILVDNYLLPLQAAPVGSGGLGTIDSSLVAMCYGNTRLIKSALYWTTPTAGDNISTIIGYGSNQLPGRIFGAGSQQIVILD